MKRILIAVGLSFLGPGLGQIYNKDYKKGVLLLALSTALFLLPLLWMMAKVAPLLPSPTSGPIQQSQIQEVVMAVIQRDKHTLNLISFAFLGLWAYAITQAYFRAREISEAEDPTDSVDPPDPSNGIF